MVNFKYKFLKYKLKLENLDSKNIQQGGGNGSINPFKQGYIKFRDIHKSISEDNFEIAGLVIIEGGRPYYYLVNRGNIIEPGDRGCVDTSENDRGGAIFHTHAKFLKYYLSFEDIRKPLKYENITVSYVYTYRGYWKIERDSGYSFDINTEKYRDDVEELNSQFYELTGGHVDHEKDRKQDPAYIEYYIENLHKITNNALRIKWSSYN